MSLIPLIAAAVLLAGCASAQQRADEAAQKAKLALEQDKADDAECKAYSTPPAGSVEAYNQCREMLKSSRPLTGSRNEKKAATAACSLFRRAPGIEAGQASPN